MFDVLFRRAKIWEVRGCPPWTSLWRISVKTGKRASSKLLTVAGLALQVILMDRHSDSNR